MISSEDIPNIVPFLAATLPLFQVEKRALENSGRDIGWAIDFVSRAAIPSQ